MRDFEAYYAAGATWALAGDPYGRDIWRAERRVPGVDASHEELLPFVGPPFSLPLWRALALLDYRSATFAWGALLVLAGGVLAFGSLALAGGARRTGDTLAVAALALSFGPLTSAFALGQVALLAGGAVVATLLLLRAHRPRWAAFCALVAALQPNVGLVLGARLGEARVLFALAFAMLAAVGGSLAAVGFEGVQRYALLLAAHAQAERTLAIQMTVGAVAYGLGFSSTNAATIQFGAGALVVAIFGAALATRRYGALERVALAAALLPLAVPFAHEHDLTLALFAAILVLRRARGAASGLVIVATLLIAVDWLGLAQRPNGALQSVVLAGAAALAALALTAELRGRAWLGAGTVVALVAGAAAVAHAHPMPVWPNALGAFAAPVHVDAPTVWHAESVQSGLEARSPVWSALRAMSLLGCASLAGAALWVLRSPIAAREH